MGKGIVDRAELGRLENRISLYLEGNFGVTPNINHVLSEDYLERDKLRRLYSELRQETGITIPSRFKRPTIRRLALYLQREIKINEDRVKDEAENSYLGFGLSSA